jgi:ribosomal protein L17
MAKEKIRKNRVITVLISLLAFFTVFLGTTGILYVSSDTFKEATNNLLKQAPGPIGNYFSRFPTESERNEKKVYLSNYYLQLDTDSAADKIYIIKKNDEKLYSDIIKIMNSISPEKTEEIIKKVRNIELRKDLLFSIYDEIQNEKKTKLLNEVERVEKLDTYLAIKEIKESIDAKKEKLYYYADILSYMDEDKASELLYRLDLDTQNKIIALIDASKLPTIESKIKERELKSSELINLAKNYEVKDSKKAFAELGNTNNYNFDELAIIFMNMSTKKAAEILVKSDDEQFIENLFSAIRKEERFLNNQDGSKTVKIRKYISFLDEYSKNIDELAKIYEKMDSEDVAEIISRLMINNERITLFAVDEQYSHEISDYTIILDVIRSLNKSKVSEILKNLDSRKAAEITEKLVIPD